MHALNNCVDHGYVFAKDRGASGIDSARFAISSSCSTGERVSITIQDDGAGIDYTRLGSLALGQGRGVLNRQALREFVFAAGTSTAQALSHTSGRGVGMGAIRAKARELNGDVALADNVPLGLIVTITLPLVAITDAPKIAA